MLFQHAVFATDAIIKLMVLRKSYAPTAHLKFASAIPDLPMMPARKMSESARTGA